MKASDYGVWAKSYEYEEDSDTWGTQRWYPEGDPGLVPEELVPNDQIPIDYYFHGKEKAHLRILVDEHGGERFEIEVWNEKYAKYFSFCDCTRQDIWEKLARFKN